MKNVVEKSIECCGCTVCSNICPASAVTMTADKEGFLYPVIDNGKCIDCKLCQRVCPTYYDLKNKGAVQYYYAVSHKSKEVVARSTSGGVFTALSDYILQNGGVVYGALYDSAFHVKHEGTSESITRNQFCGSKYIQSDMGNIVKDIVSDLAEGKYVMFTGTPCQTAGVHSYVLKKRGNREGLFLCDFLCHGVTSPKVWEDYVGFLNKRHNHGLESYKFRGKKDGRHVPFSEIIAKGEDISLQYKNKESYFLLYSTCFINRPSCYNCRYTSYDRASDVTLGDFWNIGKIAPQMDDNKGVSQVLINTELGKEWFEKCKDSFSFLQCKKEDVWQPHLEYSEKMPYKRKLFWEDYENLTFDLLIKKYGKGSFMSECKKQLIPIIKKAGLYVFAGKMYKVMLAQRGKK